jgi:hypothetical protein
MKKEVKRSMVETKMRKLAVELPAEYLFRAAKVREDDFNRGIKTTIKDIIQESLDMYFKSRGYPTVRHLST